MICQNILLGNITGTGLTHDTDKLFLYGITSKKEASKIHTKYANHHIGNFKSPMDSCDCVIDYECARYTKPDKPLNALETILKYTPNSQDLLRPTLESLGINSIEHRDIEQIQTEVVEVLCYYMQLSVERQLYKMLKYKKMGADIEYIVSAMYC